MDAQAVIAANPALMPELGDRLRDVLTLNAIRREAQAGVARPGPRGPVDAVLDDELEVLRRALTKYEILERVRYGGQGVVFRARQRGSNRIVAVKVLLDGPLASEHQRHRFEREIELIARLRHPNIVTVYDSGVVRSRNYYAMEFIEGLPIDDYVVRHDLTPPRVVQLMVKIAQAVHHAHQHGIIHRDLNPSNILVDEQGEPRVYDFGLAKDLWASADFTAAGFGVGTLPYLSPEQAGGGDGRADVRSDVYALGVVLYELLTDTLPYEVDDDPETVRRRIISAEPLPLRKALTEGDPVRAPEVERVDRDLEAVLERALAKEKSERYQSAVEFADELERWLRGDEVRARAGSRLYRLRKTVRRHSVAFVIAATLVLALVVSAGAISVGWLHARAQRDNAREAARTAFDLFDMALSEVEESVRPLPGGVAVRDRLIGKLAETMPNLERLIASDAALAPVQLRLQLKRGDVAAAQGQRAAAHPLFETALAQIQTRIEQEGLSEALAAQLLGVYRRLAEVRDDAEALLDEAIAAGGEFMAAHPEWEEARYELCRVHLAATELANQALTYDKRARIHEGTLRLLETRGEAPDGGLHWMRLRATTLSGYGMVLYDLGRAAEGIEAQQAGAGLRKIVLGRLPADTKAREDAIASLVHLANLHSDSGQISLARDKLEDAVQHAELLVQMDPDAVTWGRMASGVYHKLVDLDLKENLTHTAQMHAARALELSRRTAALRGRSGQEDLAESLDTAGEVLQAQKEYEKAAVLLEEALTIREHLWKLDPNHAGYTRTLASALDRLAGCKCKLGQEREAVQMLKRVAKLSAALASQQPRVVPLRLDLAATYINLAAAHISCRTGEDDAAADEALDEALATLTAISAMNGFVGRERLQRAYEAAVEKNRAILDERHNQYDRY